MFHVCPLDFFLAAQPCYIESELRLYFDSLLASNTLDYLGKQEPPYDLSLSQL